MLPKEWHRSTLGEIARITSGGTPDRSKPEYWGGDIPWVTTGEIQFNTITDTGEKITAAGLQNSSAKLFPLGTLLMAMYGQGKTRGQVAKLGIEAATNQACAAILLNDNNDPDYFFQYLSSQYEEIRELGNAGTQKNLSGGILKGVLVPVPPYREQRRIAQVLTTWDQAIATAERLLANSQRCTRDLMASILSGRRRFREFTDKWRYVDLDAVFVRITRKNSTQNTNVLTISAEHGLISQRDYFNKSVASANLSGYTLLHRYDFAYNKSYSAGYPMGAIKPLLSYDAGVVSSLYLCFRMRSDVDADFDFFRHYFEAGLLDQEIEGIAQEGARNHGLLNVSVTDFFKLQLHIPTAPEQRRIAEAINVARADEARLKAQVQALRQEKAALMSQLLTGKRRVKLTVSETEVQA
ncbi:restriction endonuclease subunit S [Stenotrophomonas sp. Sa5BUN4]|uniref:Restriction endonuclease subunit S n=1 Tax=Stenotrophomonas lacuserhaii TaxID=2760084 RepID=A0A8X8FSD6_9GAMM|nr:restriction endonuclease subunit S [Stenotrophomonas pennii]MBD7954287.1 restriction endonuclease subunit S [Stenotrophomonas pennii]